MDNPYESPSTPGASSHSEQNPAGLIGFCLSLVGFCGVIVAGYIHPDLVVFAFWLAALCLPGAAIGIAACFRSPRRLASWAVAIGLIGAMYLPTLYLAAYSIPDS